jgi:hypothetical protein
LTTASTCAPQADCRSGRLESPFGLFQDYERAGLPAYQIEKGRSLRTGTVGGVSYMVVLRKERDMTGSLFSKRIGML